MLQIFLITMLEEFFQPVIRIWKWIKKAFTKWRIRLKGGSLCPVCDKGKLERHISTKHFCYKEKSLVVENYITYDCPKCGEQFDDYFQMKSLTPKIKKMQGRK